MAYLVRIERVSDVLRFPAGELIPVIPDVRWERGLAELESLLSDGRCAPSPVGFGWDPNLVVCDTVCDGNLLDGTHQIATWYCESVCRSAPIPLEHLIARGLPSVAPRVDWILIWGIAKSLPFERCEAIETALAAQCETTRIAWMVAEDEVQLLWLAAKTLAFRRSRPMLRSVYYASEQGPHSFASNQLAILGPSELDQVFEATDNLTIFSHGRSFETVLLRSSERNVTLCARMARAQTPPSSPLCLCIAAGEECFRDKMINYFTDKRRTGGIHEKRTAGELRARIVVTNSCSAWRLGESDVAAGCGMSIRLLDGWTTGVVASRYETCFSQSEWLSLLKSWVSGGHLGGLSTQASDPVLKRLSILGDPAQSCLVSSTPTNIASLDFPEVAIRLSPVEYQLFELAQELRVTVDASQAGLAATTPVPLRYPRTAVGLEQFCWGLSLDVRDPDNCLATMRESSIPASLPLDSPRGVLVIRRFERFLLEKMLGITSGTIDWRDGSKAIEEIASRVNDSYVNKHWAGAIDEYGFRYREVDCRRDGKCPGCALPTLFRTIEITAGITNEFVLRSEQFCPRCGQVSHYREGGQPIRFTYALDESSTGGDLILRDFHLPSANRCLWANVYSCEHPPPGPRDCQMPVPCWTDSFSGTMRIPGECLLPGGNQLRIYLCSPEDLCLEVTSIFIPRSH